MRKSIRSSVAVEAAQPLAPDNLQGLQHVPKLSALASYVPTHNELNAWLDDFFSLATLILRCSQIIFGPLTKTSRWPAQSKGEELLPPSLAHELITELQPALKPQRDMQKLSQKCGKVLQRRWPAIAQTVVQALHCGAFCAVVMPPKAQIDGNLFAMVWTLLDAALLRSGAPLRPANLAAAAQPDQPARSREHIEEPPGILICTDQLQPVFANEALLRLIAAPSASLDNPMLAGLYPLIQTRWNRRQPSQIIFDLQAQIAIGGPGFADILPIRLGEAEFVLLIFHRGVPPAVAQRELATSTIHAALSELASGMLHEINNPTTSIINYAKLLQMETVSGAEGQEFAEAIAVEGERIAFLARSLQFSGALEATPAQHTSINQLVSATLSLHQARLGHDRITLEYSYEDSMPEILCRPNQIVAALTHLLQNARLALNARFTDENKVLRLSTTVVKEKETAFAQVLITDNGIGIAPEITSLIFTPYFSAWPKNRRAGMGLFVARTIARAHGGDILLLKESRSRTTFALRLPVA